jgi:D-alanyl-D-alanine carboxypeptidase (penicillin-binding protein 5/6)
MRKVIIFLIILGVCLAQLSGIATAAQIQPPFTLSCNAIYIVNTDTNTVIYQKNANLKVYPASLTKLMTAILTIEKFKDKLDTVVTISREDTDPLRGTSSSSANLMPGEQLTVNQLLYCLLMESANETANALARVVAGNVDDFVVMMNKKAKDIGAKDTNYVNTHGLQDPNHYTTAYDTYLIAKYAMQYDVLKTIVSTNKYDFPQTNKHPAHPISNTNSLLNVNSKYYLKYVQGIKTGTTTEAGTCLASYAIKSGYTYYCVAMGGPKQLDSTTNVANNLAFSDTKNLYQWVFNTFVFTPLVQKQDPQAQVKVSLAWQKDHILLYPEKEFEALIPKNSDLSKVRIVPHVPVSIQAPVKVGTIIGNADVYFNDQLMGNVKLVYNEKDDVALSQPLYFLFITGEFFNSIWFKLLCILLVFSFSMYIIITFFMKRKKNFLSRSQGKKYHLKK